MKTKEAIEFLLDLPDMDAPITVSDNRKSLQLTPRQIIRALLKFPMDKEVGEFKIVERSPKCEQNNSSN
ncbi:MAG: hypothetical protein PHQ43_14130 [Dehalococcoidales bacterium]|jgi:hypothetical protein|nr:hypothetical protein [Dehalococcoidales bacterium]